MRGIGVVGVIHLQLPGWEGRVARPAGECKSRRNGIFKQHMECLVCFNGIWVRRGSTFVRCDLPVLLLGKRKKV